MEVIRKRIENIIRDRICLLHEHSALYAFLRKGNSSILIDIELKVEDIVIKSLGHD